MNRASFLKRTIALAAYATLEPQKLSEFLEVGSKYPLHPQVIEHTVYVIDPSYVKELWLPGTKFVYDPVKAHELRYSQGIYLPGSGNADVGASLKPKSGLVIIKDLSKISRALDNDSQRIQLSSDKLRPRIEGDIPSSESSGRILQSGLQDSMGRRELLRAGIRESIRSW